MIATIFIEPHERYEALEVYKDRLSANQIEEIEDAPESAIIQLRWGFKDGGASVTIIEEG
jgi:hypothetical protein